MNAARIYMRYAGISIRSQMQYRASFVMLAIGHFLGTGVEILGIWALFARFRTLGVWRLPEVALFYGLVNVAFALAESVGRGFDLFPGMVKGGQFDRLLLRPRSTALQVAACELQLMRVGRFGSPWRPLPCSAGCACSWACSSSRRRWRSGPPRRWS